MKIYTEELGGPFESALLPDVIEGIAGHENFTVNTTSVYINVSGVSEALRPAVLAALQAHVLLGPDGWAALKAEKDADPNNYDPVTKSLALVMLLYHNHLRTWMRTLETEMAAATSLSDLQARMATLPDVPHVPKSTLKQDVEAQLA